MRTTKFMISIHDGFCEYSMEVKTDYKTIGDITSCIHRVLGDSAKEHPQLMLRQASCITALIQSIQNENH